MKKVTDLPDKNKRPKNKPRKQIKVNSFATAMLAKAEQDKYKGPQAVDENGHTKENPKEKYENDAVTEFWNALFPKIDSEIAEKDKRRTKIDPSKVINFKDKK